MSFKNPRPRVALVIPTLNAGERWLKCLEAVQTQSFQPDRLLNIDSESTDDTALVARSAGFESIVIARSRFNHGGTRQWAVEHLSDCEIIIFLTQDAILSSSGDIRNIVQSFDDPTVAVAYGRQIPHEGATGIEAHARLFNYGVETVKKDAYAARQMGTKVFFCSNSFAAYRRSSLLLLGGFRQDLILGEDMEFAARAIKAGYSNLYCASAIARHSHDYSIMQVIARYFDIGVFDTHHPWMRREFGSHTGEGFRFIRSELRYLAAAAPLEIPRAVVQTAGKLFGYRLGRMERWLPLFIKRKLSMQPSFWN